MVGLGSLGSTYTPETVFEAKNSNVDIRLYKLYNSIGRLSGASGSPKKSNVIM